MVIVKTKFPLPLLFSIFFTLFLSSGCNQIYGQKTAVGRCLDEFRAVEESFSGIFSCAASCERKYSKWEPESSPRELEQCQQRCLAEERDSEQQQRCQSRCIARQRERELERERERQKSEEGMNRVPRDPEEEYKECKELCERQEARQKRQCKRRYVRQYKEQQHQGGRDDDKRDPQRQYEQCRKQCERTQRRDRGEQQREQCKSWCEKQRKKEGNYSSSNWQGSEEEQQRNNPYYFHSQRFRYRLRSDAGYVRILQRFSHKSRLLRGIDNYRLAILEANPSTLVVPHHSDAETILVVLRGKGVITLLSHEKRESFNMEHGNAIRVPAGTTYYLINQDNVDRLQVAKLIQPVNTPGQFREYYAAGGGNSESYYRVFSYDILERALNTPRRQLHSLFEGQQRQQGTIIRASQEQLKALTQHASSPRRRGKGSTGPFNLLCRKPLYNNNFGRFFEATPNDYQQLQEIDAAVTYMEINQGGMMVPHYNSKTTTVVLVVEGKGRFEMGCPHLSSQWSEESEREQEEEEEESSEELQKISANLSPGDVFIIPGGHPIAVIASPNEKLQTIGFGINAMNNQRNFLAGKNNIMNQVEREAMEVAFNVPARSVERIFSNNPNESYFVAGPELTGPEEAQQQRDEAGNNSKSLPPILEVAGVFLGE